MSLEATNTSTNPEQVAAEQAPKYIRLEIGKKMRLNRYLI
jgi:hypothetical protein